MKNFKRFFFAVLLIVADFDRGRLAIALQSATHDRRAYRAQHTLKTGVQDFIFFGGLHQRQLNLSVIFNLTLNQYCTAPNILHDR